MNALARNELHHAYLFTGTRGVGKTTIARIFAKCLNCDLGVVAIPCNQCEACRAIDSGCYLDLLEVDAASKTRVEDTRDLLDNVQYAPTSGRYKIYLIDEVHMLSGHSFNALLKTLEEPPAHVKFILATTDPEKIPVTVLSRCLNFHLRALSESEITQQLALILTQQNQSYEEAALALIAKVAQGSMRDALSLLEQAISFSQGAIELSGTELMLGMQYRQYLQPLVQAIFDKDVAHSLRLIDQMMGVGAEAEDVLAALLEQLYQFSAQSLLQTKKTSDTAKMAIPCAEILQLLYQIGLQGQRDLPFAPSQRIGLEMTALRMIAFYPDNTQTRLTEKTANEEKSTVVKSVERRPQEIHTIKPAENKSTPCPPKESISPLQRPEKKEVSWHQIVEALPLAGLARILLKHCSVVTWHENKIHLSLDVSQEPCLNQSRQQQIQQALSDYLGNPIHLKITCGASKEMTPIQHEKKQYEKSQQDAMSILLNDEKVQALMKTFDATIEQVSSVGDN